MRAILWRVERENKNWKMRANTLTIAFSYFPTKISADTFKAIHTFQNVRSLSSLCVFRAAIRTPQISRCLHRTERISAAPLIQRPLDTAHSYFALKTSSVRLLVRSFDHRRVIRDEICRLKLIVYGSCWDRNVKCDGCGKCFFCFFRSSEDVDDKMEKNSSLDCIRWEFAWSQQQRGVINDWTTSFGICGRKRRLRNHYYFIV